MKQIWGESLVTAFLATVLAAVVVELALPAFNNFTGKKLILEWSDYSHPLGLLALALTTGLLAGAFPALYFSSFRPLQAFMNKWIDSRSGGLRRSLVVVQFIASVFLIIVTLVISAQLSFMKNRKLGFQKENIVCLPVKANVGSRYPAFRSELLRRPDVRGVTIKNSLLTEAINNTRPWWEGKKTDADCNMEIAEVDCHFIKTLRLTIVEGRDFSEEYPADISDAFIINETAARSMGLKNPVGTRVKAWGKDGHIIGIVNDAHFKPLRHPLRPMIFHLANTFGDDGMNLFGVIYVSVNPARVVESIQSIRNTWETFNPDYPFEFQFLDETYDNLYRSEERLAEIFSLFTVLALVVTVLGLFGLASFMTEQRIKEIGIRKVLGASVTNILSLLSANFTRWLIVANVIAWPAAWLTMHQWLQSYAYHTEVSWLTFILAGLITLCTTLATVGLVAIRAATANPVESLRYE